jgi:hypothetical protein
MLDYIFFDTTLSGKFKDHLIKVGIKFTVENDDGFGSVQGEIVAIPDETSEGILDELQILYDKLQDELEQILEDNGNGLLMNAAGMQTQLKDGAIQSLIKLFSFNSNDIIIKYSLMFLSYIFTKMPTIGLFYTVRYVINKRL